MRKVSTKRETLPDLTSLWNLEILQLLEADSGMLVVGGRGDVGQGQLMLRSVTGRHMPCRLLDRCGGAALQHGHHRKGKKSKMETELGLMPLSFTAMPSQRVCTTKWYILYLSIYPL